MTLTIRGANGLLTRAASVSTRAWALGTLTGALAITLADAALLQQKKSFFTGGFLVATHATSLAESAGFLAASLLADASLIGLVAVFLLWLTSSARLTPVSRLALVALGATAPLAIWDFVNYSLLAYLGDAFDLGLMFDLTGRAPDEVFAVASSHLVLPAFLILVAIAAIGGIVWALNRYGAAETRSAAAVPRRLAAVAAVLFLVGFVASVTASGTSDLLEDGLRRKASGQVFTRVTDAVTDFDGDGFGIGGRTSDPAPFNGAVYPYAIDRPGNGIDEDAIGGDLPADAPAYDETAPAASFQRRPDVVFFVLESFRADAVGRLVNGKPVTPVLDAIAREGVSSSSAFSHNGYTTQSRFHLFTGSLAGGRGGSLVDDFKANGYQTAYFSGQDESFGGSSLGVGFDRAEVAYDARQDRDRRYSTSTTAGSLAVSHATLQERIVEFLRTRDRSRPLFLYVNFHDTHFPYHHRDMAPLVSDNPLPRGQIRPGRKDAVQEMYFNAAANVDRAVGTTLAAVTRAAPGAPAVIVTADHGESLFDESFLGHGYALNDVQTRIPLIVRGLALQIAEPFGQVDLRSAVGAALSGAAPADAGPRVFADPQKTVFQYFGNIDRPRQIAFESAAGRLVYDFRNTRVILPDGASVHPASVDGEAARELRRLIHFWERMMLARSASGAPRDE